MSQPLPTDRPMDDFDETLCFIQDYIEENNFYEVSLDEKYSVLFGLALAEMQGNKVYTKPTDYINELRLAINTSFISAAPTTYVAKGAESQEIEAVIVIDDVFELDAYYVLVFNLRNKFSKLTLKPYYSKDEEYTTWLSKEQMEQMQMFIGDTSGFEKQDNDENDY